MTRSLSTRRAFLTGHTLTDRSVVYPPGATEATIQECSGCGHCIDDCPTNIIVMRSGIPIVDFANGECIFCGRCADRCPERVFPPEPVVKFSHHATIDDSCLATNYVDCQACRDICPTTAIRFRPRLGGPFVPALDANACSGCGACISICPTHSISIVHPSREPSHA